MRVTRRQSTRGSDDSSVASAHEAIPRSSFDKALHRSKYASLPTFRQSCLQTCWRTPTRFESRKLLRVWATSDNRGFTSRRSRDERGVVGGAEAVIFGALLVVVTSLISLNAWQNISAKANVQSIARNVSLELSRATSAQSARAIVESNMAGTNASISVVDVQTGHPLMTVARCQRIRVDVEVTVASSRIPFLSDSDRTRTVRASSTALVAPYQSGSLDPRLPSSECA
jgi:hypothetical protein